MASKRIRFARLESCFLADKGGFARSNLTMFLSEERQPGPEICRAIARVFDVSEVFVFQKAGLLSPQAGYDITYEEWRQVLNELNDQNRQELLHIARLRLERQRDEAWSHNFRELTPAQQEEAWQLIEDLIKRKGWKFEE